MPNDIILSPHSDVEVVEAETDIWFMGRKSKYNAECKQKIIDYLNRPMTKEFKDEDGKVYLVTPAEMPSVVGLALCLGVHRETIYKWCRDFKEFKQSFETLKQVQKQFLLYHGLTKGYDSGFAKFVAINCTDMVDKKEHAISSQKIEITVDSDDIDL